jgi:preprotein translocase subunit SecD
MVWAEDSSYDMKNGHLPALNIILLKNSAGVFAKVTEENIGKKLSMFMDDELVSGHIVREKIPDGRLIITYCAPGPAYHPEDVSAILRNGPLTSEVSILKCEESK